MSALDGRWSTRLLLIAVALGLVLMHHLAAAHQHSPGAALEGGAATEQGAPASGATLDPPPMPASAPAAMLHVHPDGHHDTVSAAFHSCLAVLAAMVVLVAPPVLARTLAAIHPPCSARRVARRAPVRGPPTPRRLSRLQVLRL